MTSVLKAANWLAYVAINTVKLVVAIPLFILGAVGAEIVLRAVMR